MRMIFFIFNLDIIRSIIIFSKYYINNLVYKEEKLCNEEYDILYHTRIKYIFKDITKLLSINNNYIIEEVVNVVSSIYSIYNVCMTGVENENVNNDDNIKNIIMKKSFDENIDINNKKKEYTLYDLSVYEKKDIIQLYFNKSYIFESFLKCNDLSYNIYENFTKNYFKK
ncbi:conserved Plasmodium membrane protein, unknown function [Plasmodium sp. DRC-Itaito]|nr:conserved Plasmodium membrane protein, unknown function [Plasmodium sp. DRC-Itaito]